MNRNRKIIAGVIITVSVVLAVTSAWNDSVIVDEVPHIGAGYSYLVKHDYRLNPEHPPLAKELAALPLLFLNLNQSAFQQKFWTDDVNGQWDFGRFLIFNSGNNADLIKHLVKLPMLIFFVLSVILIFKWSRKLYGDAGAYIALLIFSFSPTVIAHSRFVTTDMPALFGVLAATYFFLKYLDNPDRKNLIIASLIFGVALLLKFSTFLLVPYFLIAAFFWGLRKNFTFLVKMISRTILIFIIGFVVIVWPVYYLSSYKYPPQRQRADTVQNLLSFGNKNLANVIIWASDKPIIRAAGQYGLGLLMVNQRASGGNTTYFLGEVSNRGWHKYFPIVYFIKEPFSWWGLVILAALFLGWSRSRFVSNRKSRILDFGKQNRDRTNKPSRQSLKRLWGWTSNHFTEFAMILWLAIYWATSIRSNLNIGVRHLLPVFPFAIILVSGQISRIINWARAAGPKALAAVMLTVSFFLSWQVLESTSIYPFYLTYFNQIVGGPSGGYRFVVDSNLDWGQDLLRLSRWVKQNNIPKVETDYFGWANPAYYMGSSFIGLSADKYKNKDNFIAQNQSGGWMAVSATFLQNSVGPKERPNTNNYLWLQIEKPVTVIGNSIFVYKIE